MQHGDVIAEVYLRPARSYTVKPTPGRRLVFDRGYARVHTDAELDYVLGLPEALIEPVDRYSEHIAQRIAAREEHRPARASMDLTPGTCLASEYPALLKDHPAPVTVIEPEPADEDPRFTAYSISFGNVEPEPAKGKRR